MQVIIWESCIGKQGYIDGPTRTLSSDTDVSERAVQYLSCMLKTDYLFLIVTGDSLVLWQIKYLLIMFITWPKSTFLDLLIFVEWSAVFLNNQTIYDIEIVLQVVKRVKSSLRKLVATRNIWLSKECIAWKGERRGRYGNLR